MFNAVKILNKRIKSWTKAHRVQNLLLLFAHTKFMKILTKKFNPIIIAKQYVEGGATCLSILTEDKFFLGKKNYIKQIKKRYKIPILAKDFFIDPFQIYEAKFYGADCILILLSAVKQQLAIELYDSGYQITGVDLKAEMINKAIEKKIALEKLGEKTEPINTSILWATNEQKQEAKSMS